MFNSHCKSCEYRTREKRGAEICELYGEPLSELEEALPNVHCKGYREVQFTLGKPSRNREIVFPELNF